MRCRLLVAVLLCLLAASCTASGDVSLDPAATAEPSLPDPTVAAENSVPEPTVGIVPEIPEQGAFAAGPPAADRIVVAAASGQVYLVDPDGQQRLDLVQAGVGLQPVWSPDGRRIAWSQRDALGFSISSTNADGTEPRRAETLFSGYFGYWSPTSRWLGFLGSAAPGTGLVLDDGTGTTLNATVDSDTFYYFSWNPDGTQWVVHSGSGFSIVDLDGTRTLVDLAAGRFRAPTWADDGTILLAARIGERHVIVQLDPDTGDVTELVEVGDVTNFVLDPTGRYLAIESLVFEEGETDPGSGITVSAGFQTNRSGSEVLIYDMTTGALRQIFDERTGGFWWSPDGTSLAMLVPEATATPEFAQWLVWQSGESFRTERFKVTPALASAYIPFFDQFAQSVTPWSPDSSRFVYSAIDDTGEPGVFVQPARANTPAERISDDAGVAFWSPT